MLSDTPWIVILWPVLMLGVIVVAAGAKYIEVNNAKSWRSAPGKVVSSGVQRRKVKIPDSDRTDGGAMETRNFANVIYEYEVFGKKLRNNRVSIGEDLGNFEVEETLARYPIGTAVTVFYNPKQPTEAVLERDAPKGMWGCIAGFIVVALAGYAVVLFGLGPIHDALQSALPSSQHTGLVMALAAFGLLSALMAEGIRRNVARTRAWPVAPGIIEKAGVEHFEGYIGSRTDNNSRPQTLYRSDLVYSYVVGGKTYSGSKLGTLGTVTANAPRIAEKAMARFKPGQAVRIHYDPKNPSDAVLDPRMQWGFWLIWLVPIGCAVGAYFAAQ